MTRPNDFAPMPMSGHCATPQSAPSDVPWGPHELCRKPGCTCVCHYAELAAS